jgi:carbamoyltransferase
MPPRALLVLGISAYYHDSAAALVRDGAVVAAAQEERFSRVKHDAGFPAGAVRYCLDEAGVSLDDIDWIGFYDKPILTFDRLLETFIAFCPKGFGSFTRAMPVWIKEKLFQKSLLAGSLNALDRGKVAEDRVLFGFHHHSHAASCYYPSPFDEAAILVMDGVGEWSTTSMGRGQGRDVTLLKEIRFPHSLGLLYSAFTYYLGFEVNEGEYKVMGLAPYGEPRYAKDILDNLIDLKSDGSFRLDMDYFNYATGLTMTNARFDALFGAPPRHVDGRPIGQREMDLARSLQAVTEEAVLRIVRTLHAETGSRNLCLAGGVALNCVANGRILREGPFQDIWIQPAAGDAGGALGVALAIAHAEGAVRPALNGWRDRMDGAYLGPSYGADEIRAVLDRHGARYELVADDALYERIARSLAAEKVVGWFQGRMEFGPRALGNRSILGDPRSPRMQRTLNMKIKYRESFRPFAPAVLGEEVADWFEIDRASPYMLLVAPVREDRRRAMTEEERGLTGLSLLNVPRSDIPAVTHVDYSARVQTVDAKTNPRFHRLIAEFGRLTGCPVLVNTSFNIRDEPIVCSPEDAYRCFMGTEMDTLVMENFVLEKSEQ